MCKHGDSCGKLGSYLVKNFAKFCCQLCSVLLLVNIGKHAQAALILPSLVASSIAAITATHLK